jgi:hypothetical protein
MSQDTFFTIDKGDLTHARAGVAIALVEGNTPTLGSQRPRIQSFFALGSLNDGEVEIFVP